MTYMSVTIPNQVTEKQILSSFVRVNAVDRHELMRQFGKGAAPVIDKLVKARMLKYLGPENGSEMEVTLVITFEGKKALIEMQ
ncbi:MAG TPA: hypothetical protein VMV00_00245 [Candidatus Baltobacteraceae bacterium]|nr:hypothetical protein [Candidatus Baltobacteraceae bacterium]